MNEYQGPCGYWGGQDYNTVISHLGNPADTSTPVAKGGGGYCTKFNTWGGSALKSNPLPFIYHFGRKGTPFIYLLLKKVPLSHTYFMKSCSHFHLGLDK